MELIVKNDDKLLNYLVNNLDMSRKKIKSYLVHGQIYIDNQKVTKYDYILNKGMKIKIETKNKNTLPFDIIYEDDFIIVVNKPSNLLSIATKKEKEKTLYHYVREYVKSKNNNNKIFIVHRLDKETSGVVILAKDEKTKNELQKNWNELVKTREYHAIVHGILNKKKDRLVNYLKENKTNYVYITKQDGKEAITNYQVIKENKNYSLLKINIETGRKNQIRVQLNNINHKIVGDNKYGEKDGMKRLFLHANKISLYYKPQRKVMTFQTDVPASFKSLIGGK